MLERGLDKIEGNFIFYFFNPHRRACLLILEREEGRERERGRETLIGYLLNVPDWGVEPTISACAL